MQERVEFESLDQFLEQASRVKIMYSRDGTHFFRDYEGMQNYYQGDLLMSESYLKQDRKYYIIKAK